MARASRLALEWLLERVNTRFLSTVTPAWPRAVLIITTKLPFVAAITRRRCRGKTPSILSGENEKERERERERERGREKDDEDERVRAEAGRVEKGQHRRLVERHGLPTSRKGR